MVDMSVTLIHHGHIRLLKKANEYGKVIVALTTDKEIKKFKGYKPEMSFAQRKEILKSIRYVNKVVASKFTLNDKFLIASKLVPPAAFSIWRCAPLLAARFRRFHRPFRRR